MAGHWQMLRPTRFSPKRRQSRHHRHRWRLVSRAPLDSAGLVDHTHAARAEFGADALVSYGLANHERERFIGCGISWMVQPLHWRSESIRQMQAATQSQCLSSGQRVCRFCFRPRQSKMGRRSEGMA
jgi:hypothetical protein